MEELSEGRGRWHTKGLSSPCEMEEESNRTRIGSGCRGYFSLLAPHLSQLQAQMPASVVASSRIRWKVDVWRQIRSPTWFSLFPLRENPTNLIFCTTFKEMCIDFSVCPCSTMKQKANNNVTFLLALHSSPSSPTTPSFPLPLIRGENRWFLLSLWQTRKGDSCHVLPCSILQGVVCRGSKE